MEALWEKILFWKTPKRKTPEYHYIDAGEYSTWVQITSGVYSGVVLSYGTVQFEPQMIVPILKFDYSIIHPGNHDFELLKTDQEFVTIIGDILTDIIIKNEPTRSDNPEELNVL